MQPQPNDVATEPDAPSQMVAVYCPSCATPILAHFVYDAGEDGWSMSGAVADCPKGCDWPPETQNLMEEIAEAKAAQKVISDA